MFCQIGQTADGRVLLTHLNSVFYLRKKQTFSKNVFLVLNPVKLHLKSNVKKLDTKEVFS